MTINRTEYESYQIINVDSMGFVEMGDDPPCYWWLVIRCDSEWDRWKYGKANTSQGPRAGQTLDPLGSSGFTRYDSLTRAGQTMVDDDPSLDDHTSLDGKRKYHSIIKELWA